MSVVAGPGLGASLRAKSRGAGFLALAGLIVLVHLAALAVLLERPCLSNVVLAKARTHTA